MRVSVCACLAYDFVTEIPDDVKTPEDALAEADFADPAFQDICKILDSHNLGFDANIVSVVREDTDEVLYTM